MVDQLSMPLISTVALSGRVEAGLNGETERIAYRNLMASEVSLSRVRANCPTHTEHLFRSSIKTPEGGLKVEISHRHSFKGACDLILFKLSLAQE